MAIIGQYRKKIKSAKNIAKLTRAMQFVAASKMKKAQVAATSGKDYVAGITELSNLLASNIDSELHPLIGKKINSSAPALVILIAPQKGLCGGLVTNMTKYVVSEFLKKGDRFEFIVVGNKARQIGKRLNLKIIADFDLELSYPKYEFVPPIARIVEERFLSDQTSRVYVVFAEFITTMQQIPQKKTLLPLELAIDVVDTPDIDSSGAINKEYIFDPSALSIVNPLLEMYLETEIYQTLLEAYASEQSARMVAMKNATDNATTLIDDLTIEYNKLRQAGITGEILDQ